MTSCFVFDRGRLMLIIFLVSIVIAKLATSTIELADGLFSDFQCLNSQCLF